MHNNTAENAIGAVAGVAALLRCRAAPSAQAPKSKQKTAEKLRQYRD
jgi:hypothetical protein